MKITLDLSDDIAHQFADDPAGLSRSALEALATEGARPGHLTTEHVRRLLGFNSRYESDRLLKEHGVFYALTAEQAGQDANTAWEFNRCSSLPTPPRSTTSS